MFRGRRSLGPRHDCWKAVLYRRATQVAGAAELQTWYNPTDQTKHESFGKRSADIFHRGYREGHPCDGRKIAGNLMTVSSASKFFWTWR
jgi:hypothetical protein